MPHDWRPVGKTDATFFALEAREAAVAVMAARYDAESSEKTVAAAKAAVEGMGTLVAAMAAACEGSCDARRYHDVAGVVRGAAAAVASLHSDETAGLARLRSAVAAAERVATEARLLAASAAVAAAAPAPEKKGDA